MMTKKLPEERFLKIAMLAYFDLTATSGDNPQKMTFLWKFYVIFVPERHFCGVSPALCFLQNPVLYTIS
jgi:hypothetical protein